MEERKGEEAGLPASIPFFRPTLVGSWKRFKKTSSQKENL